MKMKKETKIELIIIVILIIILVPLVIITINTINNKGFNPEFDKNSENRKFGDQNEEEKETTASDVEPGEIVTQKEINLSDYNSNITIENSGEYTLKGSFSNSVLINSTSDVALILDNVTIQNDITATIANIGKGNLTIKLKDGTTNTLTDGGSSEYDSCIYSVGSLTIEGNGTLNVYGKQSEGEAIATDTNNITINGGTVIAIGSDMIEKPESNSKQKSLTFNMNSSIKSGANISIKNEKDEIVTTFEAKEDFKTLIFSSSDLSNGTYYLYQNEEKTNYSATV